LNLRPYPADRPDIGGPGTNVIRRTLEISQQPVHLTVRDGQLVLLPRDHGVSPARTRTAERLASVPAEDVGLVLVDQPATTYSHAALTTLLEHDAAVVVCGRNHLPAGLLLPFGEHSQVVWRLRAQVAARRPLRKRLWRQIVQAKIRAQARNLARGTAVRTRLLALARTVRSGDPENAEAQAARAYWGVLFTGVGWADATPFRRDPDGPPPNGLLNYGYAVLRAAVARAVVGAGLLPAIGLRHANRSNAFCLADDLVEPLRPLVDRAARELWAAGEVEVTPAAKRVLLELLTAEVECGGLRGPLMVALHRYAASLVECLEGQAQALRIPVAVDEPELSAGEADPES